MSPSLRTLVIASGNRGKIREFEHLLNSLPLQITERLEADLITASKS